MPTRPTPKRKRLNKTKNKRTPANRGFKPSDVKPKAPTPKPKPKAAAKKKAKAASDVKLVKGDANHWNRVRADFANVPSFETAAACVDVMRTANTALNTPASEVPSATPKAPGANVFESIQDIGEYVHREKHGISAFEIPNATFLMDQGTTYVVCAVGPREIELLKNAFASIEAQLLTDLLG